MDLLKSSKNDGGIYNLNLIEIMDLFTKMLLDSKENDKFLCLYEYSDDDKFWFGKVIDFNEEIIIFQHYTKFGRRKMGR